MIPVPVIVTNVDTRWVEDGSFLRGKNLLLGYNVPARVFERWRLSKLRVTASVQNFFLKTKYSGNDPEVTTYSDAFAQGQTFFDYPKPTHIPAGNKCWIVMINIKQAHMKFFKINPLYILLICAFALSATGCKKWLVEVDNDPSNLAPDDFYTLPGHADAAIAAAYAQTRFIGNGAGIFANNFSMLEMPTGTAKTETGQNTDLNNLIGLSYNGDNVFVLNWWTGLYSVIAQANLVLDKVPGIKMDEAKKKRVWAKRSFCGYGHIFALVRLWGDVPLHTETSVLSTNDPKVYSDVPSKDSIYMQVISDLKAAEGSGLAWTDAGDRASLGAVKSLLAEVYLTMAGYPINKSEYYKLAADKANEVITSGKFNLFANYNSLHDETLENQQEQIFEIQYLGGVANNNNQALSCYRISKMFQPIVPKLVLPRPVRSLLVHLKQVTCGLLTGRGSFTRPITQAAMVL